MVSSVDCSSTFKAIAFTPYVETFMAAPRLCSCGVWTDMVHGVFSRNICFTVTQVKGNTITTIGQSGANSCKWWSSPVILSDYGCGVTIPAGHPYLEGVFLQRNGTNRKGTIQENNFHLLTIKFTMRYISCLTDYMDIICYLEHNRVTSI